MKNKWTKFGVGTAALLIVVGLSFGAVTTAQAHAGWFGGHVAPMGWFGGQHDGGFGQRGDFQATIAKTLGISESDLATALQGGKTVADVAKDKGVDLSKVVDALVAERTDMLKQAVTNGRLTQQQADDMVAKLKTNLPTMLSTKMPARPQGFGPRGSGMGPFGSIATIATTLGISETTLSTALQGGKSVADVAAEKGVDLNKVVDAIVAERTTALKQAVTNGRLTQQQADQIITMLKANLPHLLSLKHGAGDMGPGRHFGGRGFGRGRMQNPQSPLAPGGSQQSGDADPMLAPAQSA